VVRSIPNVEPTFGGYFTRSDPPRPVDTAVREADAAALGAVVSSAATR